MCRRVEFAAGGGLGTGGTHGRGWVLLVFLGHPQRRGYLSQYHRSAKTVTVVATRAQNTMLRPSQLLIRRVCAPADPERYREFP